MPTTGIAGFAVEGLAPSTSAGGITFGRSTSRAFVPVPDSEPRKSKSGVNYREHGFIGDAIKLTFSGGRTLPASQKRFQLENSLQLTYGQMNGLAGDFYGPQQPISDGADTSEQRELFLGAYYSLTSPSSLQPQEANNILSILQKEVDIVNNALYNHQDPSIAYAEMSHAMEGLVIGWATVSRLTSTSSGPTYSTLLHDNLDHFGDDARLVYNIGHSIALNAAHDGDLEKAYTINAFADHYLENLFTAGHLRTPRRFLHGRGLIGDLLSIIRKDGTSQRRPRSLGSSSTCVDKYPLT